MREADAQETQAHHAIPVDAPRQDARGRDAPRQDGGDWRPASLLPKGDGRDGALAFVVAVLCAVACLTAVVGLAADRAAQGWARDIRGAATVQVRPSAGETAGEAAARGAEALAGVRGVSEAAAQDRQAAEALLRPWLGGGALPEDLPIPRLVTVELDRAHPATSAELKAALSAAGVDGTVDDHARWLGDIQRAGLITRGLAIAAGIVMAAAAGAAIAFATRAGLAARRDIVEVLHLSGAEDGFVAGLFQRRFAWLAAIAGAAGAAAAGVLVVLLRLVGGHSGLTPALPVGWWDLLALLPCPVLAGLVGGAAARTTALSILKSRL